MTIFDSMFYKIKIHLKGFSNAILLSLLGWMVSHSLMAQDGRSIRELPNLSIQDSKGEAVRWEDESISHEVYTLRFLLSKDFLSQENLHLFVSRNQYVTLTIGGENSYGGKFMPTSKRALPREFYFLPLPKLSNDSLWVRVTLQNATGLSQDRQLLKNDIVTPSWRDLKIYYGEEFLRKKAEIDENDNFYVQFINLFVGAIGFTAVFVFLLFLLNKQLSFFYYSGYLLSFFLFGLFHTRNYNDVGLWLSEWPVFHQNFPEPLIWIGMFFYGFFSIHLLEITKEQYPKLRKYIASISYFSLLASVVMTVVLLWSNNHQWYKNALEWMRYAYSPMGVIGIVWILIQVKSKLKYLLVTGVSLWAILGNYSSTYAVSEGFQLTTVGLGSNLAIQWTCMGLLLESVMFSFALGVKMRNTENERIKNKEALIEKMEELQMLKEQENIKLERKVKEKSEELLKAYELVEDQKKRELEESYQKRLAISEMEALRSQMNPHFIFNSLSSIKHLVLSDEKEKSSAYLSKFAKLLRQILTFSRKDSVSLSEELQNIQTYLELESQRFSDQFSFEIETSEIPAAVLQQIEIPPLLLQPFVENALLHGLRNSPKPTKEIIITVGKEEHNVRIAIQDNGIGRKAAQAFKRDHAESLGTKITEERVALFNEMYETAISVQIKDLDSGTEVEILISDSTSD